MKPIYLEFCGINSFSEKTQIDFRKLLSGGVFGIFGDTGSGKSTILDCIHLALYGKIERGVNDCINYGADSAYVEFKFELLTDGVRRTYRIRRERKRKNNVSKAFLYECGDLGEIALAEGTRDVDAAVKEIVGFSFEDFKMCIALPQGDFAALVKAEPRERVRLVSRLFDLEKYGERLTKAARGKYAKADNEVSLLKAKMGQNEGGRVEFIEEKEREVAALKKQLDGAVTAWKQAETAYERISTLYQERSKYEDICKTLSEMQFRYAEMDEKRKAAERLPAAKLVVGKADDAEKNLRDKEIAKAHFEQAKARRKGAEAELEACTKRLKEGNFDKAVLEYSVQLEKVRGAREQREHERKLAELLQEHRRKFVELKSKRIEEDFDKKRAALETELVALGEDDSLFEYLKRNLKDVLLADAYGEIRGDLLRLQAKYPIATEDVETLLQKYAISGKISDATFDVEKITLAFKETDRKRKALKSESEQLEKRKRDYDDLALKMDNVKEQGEEYRKLHDAALAQIAFLKDLDDEDTLERKLRLADLEKAAAQEAEKAAQKTLQDVYAEEKEQSGLFAKCEETERSLDEALRKALRESDFSSADEARTLLNRVGDEAALRAECKAFFDKYELYKAKKNETDEKKFSDVDEDALRRAETQKQATQAEKDDWNHRLAVAETELKQLLAQREKYQAYEKELLEKEKDRDLCESLCKLLYGNRFLEFIVSEYLQEICVSASKTLLSLTNSRYFLRYDGEFKVGDNLDGGNLRAVKTLSGGETFLVSLSLALSLSNAICQKSLRPIEFFFLDEGFGTLDEKLVDTVMDVLGKLSKNFSVGLISHVEELKHRIDNKILVTGATETHGSRVQIE